MSLRYSSSPLRVWSADSEGCLTHCLCTKIRFAYIYVFAQYLTVRVHPPHLFQLFALFHMAEFQ